MSTTPTETVEEVVEEVIEEVIEEPDLVDPLDTLRESCGQKPGISKLWNTLQDCNERVNGKTETKETCVQELFDYVHALDHCVAKTLFTQLK